MYTFSVIATDNGAVPKSGSTLVTIRIKNVNDESPQFPVNETAGEYMTANIRWNNPTTEPVYFVQASDADANDVVTYTLVRKYSLRLVVRKPVFGVSDQVRHKPGCTATECTATEDG